MKNRLPAWFRQDIPDNKVWIKLRLLSELKINTVCKEAKCPNLNSCFKQGELTFMILGDTCTRNCRFCAVRKLDNSVMSANRAGSVDSTRSVHRAGNADSAESLDNTGIVDLDEPYRIVEAVRRLGLNYVVITSVTRDDLTDGGAGIFAQTIKLIQTLNQALNRDIKVEVLIPDFSGQIKDLKTVVDAHPDIIAHNIETVPRLYKDLRPQADYQISLSILRKIKELNPQLITKSSLMLGLGETEREVIGAMQDLKQVGCDILTLGQYLSPSADHYPVKEFISREQFKEYRRIGLSLGFRAVASAPLVRSSYQAQDLYKEALCMTLS